MRIKSTSISEVFSQWKTRLYVQLSCVGSVSYVVHIKQPRRSLAQHSSIQSQSVFIIWRNTRRRSGKLKMWEHWQLSWNECDGGYFTMSLKSCLNPHKKKPKASGIMFNKWKANIEFIFHDSNSITTEGLHTRQSQFILSYKIIIVILNFYVDTTQSALHKSQQQKIMTFYCKCIIVMIVRTYFKGFANSQEAYVAVQLPAFKRTNGRRSPGSLDRDKLRIQLIGTTRGRHKTRIKHIWRRLAAGLRQWLQIRSSAGFHHFIFVLFLMTSSLSLAVYVVLFWILIFIRHASAFSLSHPPHIPKCFTSSHYEAHPLSVGDALTYTALCSLNTNCCHTPHQPTLTCNPRSSESKLQSLVKLKGEGPLTRSCIIT